ncbi:MAG: glycogen synthase [Deltaproteobacteria bacterium]|nr:glycogen synthase [Deltaproteobacteria bacterium]
MKEKQDKLKILIAASEADPLAKAGGLGDVIGSLPLAFRRLGCQVSIVLPAYRQAMDRIGKRKLLKENLPVRLGKQKISADILEGELALKIPVYLIRRDEFFDRSELYGNSKGEYFDNLERFIFFSRTIPAMCSAIDLKPDIILGNDWQTGLVMALLHEGALPRTAGVFAIHNIGYQGIVPTERIENIGLPDRYYRMDGMEYYGRMNLLKAGIVYSQAVTTVSPTYAQEIQTPDFGEGLDGLMRSVNKRLHGILNGVDYRIWDPEKDRLIAANYSRKNLEGKTICKKDLLKEMGLPGRLLNRPLMGVITRLVDQKGCMLLAKAAKDLFNMDLGLIILGAGDDKYHDLFKRLQTHYPNVRAIGGLKDTIRDPNEYRRPGTGFKFDRFQASDLVEAIRRAVKTFWDAKDWNSMMIKAMAQDFSWRSSAKEYLAVFDQAIAARRNPSDVSSI